MSAFSRTGNPLAHATELLFVQDHMIARCVIGLGPADSDTKRLAPMTGASLVFRSFIANDYIATSVFARALLWPPEA